MARLMAESASSATNSPTAYQSCADAKETSQRRSLNCSLPPGSIVSLGTAWASFAAFTCSSMASGVMNESPSHEKNLRCPPLARLYVILLPVTRRRSRRAGENLLPGLNSQAVLFLHHK